MATNDPVIIKKIRKNGAGHHGGAWKIAYADFVTAMMAFFLLMWLINMTSPEQKKGIAEYFSPPTVSDSKSGAGGVLGGLSVVSRVSVTEGGTPTVQNGGQNQPVEIETNDNAGAPANSDPINIGGAQNGAKSGGPRDEAKSGSAQDTGEGRGAASNTVTAAGTISNGTAPGTISNSALQQAMAAREEQSFRQAEGELRQALDQVPDLKDLKNNVIMDRTPDGLRIQIIDQEGRSMFNSGGVDMSGRTKELLASVAKVVNRLPNRISISGHTDSTAFQAANGYGNWELSADRANVARRILTNSGLDPNRIYEVKGKADSDPLFPDNPSLAGNRRISVVLLRETPVAPASMTQR